VKNIRMALVAVVALLSLTAMASAQNVVGNWKGKLVIDEKSMPKMEGQQAAMMKQMMDNMKKMSFVLDLKKDKTFTVIVKGLDVKADQQPKPQTGKWVQKGNKIELSGDGANQRGQTQVFTLSKDGKKLSQTLPAGQGGPKAELVFSR
jgi:hypothetical protein